MAVCNAYPGSDHAAAPCSGNWCSTASWSRLQAAVPAWPLQFVCCPLVEPVTPTAMYCDDVEGGWECRLLSLQKQKKFRVGDNAEWPARAKQ